MSKGGRVSLSEIMGKRAGDGISSGLSLDDLGSIIGERMPKLEFHPVGRIRLLRALRDRFGTHYRNIPGISDVLKEFDSQAELAVKVEKMKRIRLKGAHNG